MKKTVILFFIIILATLLRLYNLENVPAGLDYDESEFAFNAYTISKYIKNENNQFLPYQVNTYGNYRPLGLVYFIAASLKVFGNSIFAVRLPNAIFGVIGVYLLYAFLQKLIHNRRLSLLGSFLLAVNPWYVFLSRGTAEPVMAVVFILLLLIAIINFFHTKKLKHLFFIYLFSFISFFTYTGVLPLIFLFSGALILYFFYKTKSLNFLIVIPYVTLIIFPILSIYFGNPGYLNGRFKQTSVFSGIGAEGIRLVTEEQIRENAYNRLVYQNFVTQFFHNIPVNTLNTILSSLGKHLSLDFLYFKGGEPMRLQVPQTGVFLPVEFIFVVGGGLLLFQRKKYALLSLGVVLIMISFLPAGLTIEEVPSTHRTIFAVIGFFLLESYFLVNISKSKPGKIVILGLLMIIAYETAVYLHNYLVLQPRHKNTYRHFEMYDLAKYLQKNEAAYDGVYITKNGTEPGYYYYFFNNIDPKPFIKNTTKNHLQSWDDGKFHYLHMPCADVEIKVKRALVIEGTAFCKHEGALLRYIYNSDGSTVYRVLAK